LIRLRALLRHLLVWWLPLPVMLVVLLCAFALWLAGTEPGTRMLLGVVAQQFDGRAEQVRGSVLDGLRVGRLQLALPGANVDIAGLRLDVQWRDLGHRLLHVREVSADSVQVAVASSSAEPPSDEPLAVPSLPVELALDRLALGTLDLAIDGAAVPVSISNLVVSGQAGADGARLNLASLRLEHARAAAALQGQFNLQQMASPWPMWAHLDIDTQGVGADSPLCVSRMLAGLPAKAAPAKAAPAKAAPDDAAAGAAACAATLRVDAEGSLDQLDLRMEGATADGALTLLAQAGLAFDQPFPVRTANLNLRLADKSGLVVTLDRQPQAASPAVDRVVATLDAERLDLGRLVGDAIPPALLSARMAVDAQVAGAYELRQAYVQADIVQGSRWNRQPLSGTLAGRLDAVQAPAQPRAPDGAATPIADPLAGYQLRDLRLDLTLGPNRVRAQGQLSQGDGALILDANTPRLDAFWPGLPGGATLRGKLEGRLEQHRGEFNARYTPADARADTLGRAPMQAEIVFAGGWGTGQDGQADGGLPGWRGRIERLTASSMNFSAALQPLALSFVPDAAAPRWQWQVGATQLAVTLPDKQRVLIDHQGSRGGPGRWETAGRADNLVITRSMLRQIIRATDPQAAARADQGRQRVNAQVPDGQRRIALDASWDLKFAGALSGRARVTRRDGDLRIPGDPPIPLGLTDLVLDVAARPTGASTSSVNATLDVRTRKMGVLSGSATAILVARPGGGLALDTARPMQVRLDADIADLAWVDLFVGDTMEVRGKLQANVAAQGTPGGKWSASGTIRGQSLRVVRIDDGVRLVDGTLAAHLQDTRLILDSLRFPASLRVMPDEWRTREWVTSNADAKGGYVEASGQWDLLQAQGAVHLKLHRFPALQRSDRYAMVSGVVDIDAQLPRISISGDLTADAGWFSLEILQGVPSLDDDVRVIHAGDDEQARASPLQMSMDLKFDMGPRFYITGMGLDAGLLGSIQIRMADGRLTGIGALRTRGGGIEAYGQKLRLRRGTLTFQGRLDNPLLDIEALRTGEQVEAGVRVSGTAQRPRIDLVSYPEVSDVEKLSWLILGRGPDEGGSDAALLLSVGTALLGGGQPFYRQLGLDELSIRSGTIGSSGSLLPDRTVASQINLDSNSELATQFIVASKHFANGITLSVEQAMAGSETVGRASYRLSRRLSLDLKAGTISGIALVYRTFFAD